jgi:hypothetical protein
MSHGFPSKKALDAALAIARKRGAVMFFEQVPGTPGTFEIDTPAGRTLVRIVRSLCIHGTLAGIAAEYLRPIALLRRAVLSAGTNRELWIWCPYGTMRFFRVEADGLTELDEKSEPLKLPAAGSVAGKRSGRPKYYNANNAPAPQPDVVPEKSPGTIADPPGAPQKDPVQSPPAERESPAIRYLRRRMREMHPPAGSAACPEDGKKG